MGVRGRVAVDAGHGLVTLLSLSMPVKDRLLHKPSRQVRDCCSLVVDPALSGPIVRDFLVEEVLAPH